MLADERKSSDLELRESSQREEKAGEIYRRRKCRELEEGLVWQM
jgi:hypothetical protein